MIYYVIYAGVGRDGGFGDYAGAYWDEEPVKIDGKVIWFQDQDEAQKAMDDLNEKSWRKFREAGHGDSYSGEFPIEYEWRKIVVPTGDHVSAVKATELITEKDEGAWIHGQFPWDDEDDWNED